MTNVLSTKPRFDVHRAITTTIMQAIEAGAGEFVMPWHYVGIALGRPTNAATGNRYQGANVVALWAAGMLSAFNTGYWATYRQWLEIGGQVRKGEHGSVVLFYKELEPNLFAEGKEAERRFVARASYVFNADQIDGWKPPEPEYVSSVEAIVQADALVTATGADIRHGGNVACYRFRDDYIQMPERSQFVGSSTSSATETYYSTLLHELTHWTGAAHRLNRPFGEWRDDEVYACEELVAELGAAFLCADLGISNEPRPDHAAYLAGWLRVLKREPSRLLEAVRSASAAVAYLSQAESW